MHRVVCPVCKTGFEAKFSRENCAINCVNCGVAFNASQYLPKTNSGFAPKYTGPVLLNPPPAVVIQSGKHKKLDDQIVPPAVETPSPDFNANNDVGLFADSGNVATLDPLHPGESMDIPSVSPSKNKSKPNTPAQPASPAPGRRASQSDKGMPVAPLKFPAHVAGFYPAVSAAAVSSTEPLNAPANAKQGTGILAKQAMQPKTNSKSDPNISVSVMNESGDQIPKVALPAPIIKPGPVLTHGPVLTPGPVLLPTAPAASADAKTVNAIPKINPPVPAAPQNHDTPVRPAPRPSEALKNKSGRRPILEGAFGKYDIEGEIARGGVGAVFRARDRETGQPCALKVLIDGEEAGETERDRFRHECETAKALSLPGMVQVREVGEFEGRPYMAMELVEGKSLDKVIAEKSLSVNDCLLLMQAVANTVGVLHEKGYVHRDLKPGNILLDKFGTPKVADFGLVKSLDEVTRMTASGLVCGTPAYMSPEQARGDGKNVDPRSDVWALGAVLYEMLASEPPFKADNALKLMLRITKEQPKKLSIANHKVPKDIEAIVMKCLEKKPALRYANGAELAADISAFLEGRKLNASTQSPVLRILDTAIEKRAKFLPALAAVAAIVIIAVVARMALSGHDAGPIAERGFAALAEPSRTPAEKAEKLNKAERYFREALLLDAKQARAYMGLSLCLARRSIDPTTSRIVNPALFREAERNNAYAAQLDPSLQAESCVNSARFNLWLNDHVAEAEFYKRAVKLAPNNLKYAEYLGLALWNAGAQTSDANFYQDAIKVFKWLLTVDKNYPKAADNIREIQEKFLAQVRAPQTVGMAER